MKSDLRSVNIPSPTLPHLIDGSRISIPAQPGTDLWRKPPAHNVANMPAYLCNVPISSFRRARVTVAASWERQYDQGGLVLFLPGEPIQSSWVKAGVEFYMGKPCVSVVAAQAAADWSLRPGAEHVTLEIEREEIEERTSLWVYLVDGEKRTPVREITWVFADDQKETDGIISVGMYAARPTRKGDHDVEELSVAFTDWQIDC